MRQNTNHTANALLSELFALTVDAGYDWMCSRSRFWGEVADDAAKAINAYGMQSPATVDRFTTLAATAREVAAMKGEGHDAELVADLHRIAEIAEAIRATETDDTATVQAVEVAEPAEVVPAAEAHQTPEQRAAEREAASDIEFIAAGRCWLAGYRAGADEDSLMNPVVMNPLEVVSNLDRRYPGGYAAAREQLITASREAERR